MVVYISSGNQYNIKNVTLSETFQDIDLPRSVKSFHIQEKDDKKVIWRKDSTDTDEFTFKPTQTYAIDGAMGVEVDDTITIGQAKVAAGEGSGTLEIWYWYL